jgi:hypothetical protein
VLWGVINTLLWLLLLESCFALGFRMMLCNCLFGLSCESTRVRVESGEVLSGLGPTGWCGGGGHGGRQQRCRRRWRRRDDKTRRDKTRRDDKTRLTRLGQQQRWIISGTGKQLNNRLISAEITSRPSRFLLYILISLQAFKRKNVFSILDKQLLLNPPTRPGFLI